MTPIRAAALVLVVYSGIVTLVTGDIGFEGDDWWIFSWAYWNGFPTSLVVYARESLRPIEGVYWMTLFELFGFNKPVFHLCSLLLLAGSCLAMGLSLIKAFPERNRLAVTAVFFAFFSPSVSCLTYVMTTDNSRLSLFLFWCSVLAFQQWTRRSAQWRGLFVPVLLYVLAFLTYEAATFLIVAVPILTLPVHFRNDDAPSDRSFLLRLSTGMFLGFSVAVFIRFVFLSGGAVVHSRPLPPLELIWSYLALLPIYLIEPFRVVSDDFMAWFLGLSVMLLFGFLLYHFQDSGPNDRSDDVAWWRQIKFYPAILGLTVLFLGMLPYQIAGYGSVVPKIMDSVMLKWGMLPNGNSAWFNFNWSSRIYSAGTFGMAILFAVLVDYPRAKQMRRIAATGAAVVIGFFALFHAGLIPEWQEAGRIRAQVSKDLLRHVPDVKPGTNFIFLNLDSRYERAVIFRGWMGLRALVRMLYDEPRLGAWYLYPQAWLPPNHIYQQAFVSPDGFVSRSMRMDEPVPHNSLLVFNRTGQDLEFLDGIASGDGHVQTGISWNSATSINSNVNRIIDPPGPIADPERSILNGELREAVRGRKSD